MVDYTRYGYKSKETLEKYLAYRRKLYHKLKSEGRCVKCCKANDNLPHILCKKCTEKRKRQPSRQPEHQRRKREEYKKNPDYLRRRRMAQRKYAETHKDKIKEWHKKELLKLKMEVLTHYGGNPPKCLCCGESDFEFLTVHHPEGNGREHRQRVSYGVAGNAFYRWLRINNFPPGFQVLCYNCNCAIAYYGYCPHQRELELLRVST